MINKWFSDPEDKDPSFIRMTRNILLLTLIGNASILAIVSSAFISGNQNVLATLVLSLTAAVEVIALLLSFRGNVLLGKIIIPVALLIAVTYTAISANGLHDISILGFPIVIVISALLLRRRSLFYVIPLAVICIGIVTYMDMSGANQSPIANRTGIDDALIAIVIVSITAGLLQLLITRLNESVADARLNEQEQIKANEELRKLQVELETRVVDRTAELQSANVRNEMRVNLFQAVAQVARAVASIRNVEMLLPNVANVISERLGYYHVGIFLVDPSREYASLTASNSEFGKAMMETGYQVRVGQQGVIGYVTGLGNPRVVEDIRASDTFAESFNLPETRSQAALPLKIGDTVIGALDVHSRQPNAFTEDDIAILTTLTDQIAIAIQNAQLLRETQTALAESQSLFGTYISQAWRSASSRDQKAGYRYSGTLAPLENPLTTPDIQRAISEGKVVTKGASGKGQPSFVVPVKLRDEIIGAINISLPQGSLFDEDNVDIIQAASERIALALENATLLEESQRRAAKERTIGEISAKLSGLVDVENILQTALQELGNTLPNTDIAIQFSSQVSGLNE